MSENIKDNSKNKTKDKIKINASSFDKIIIEKNKSGFSITLKSTYNREYYQGYNKIEDTYTTTSGFTAEKIEDIIMYPVTNIQSNI